MANLVKKKMKNTGKARSTAKPDILGFDENGKPIKAKKPMKNLKIQILIKPLWIIYIIL